MAPDHQEVADQVVEEVSAEEAAAVAGWEVTARELVQVGIVSAPVAEQGYPIR